MTCRQGDGKRVILCQRVRGFVRAVRAAPNTRMFQTETMVVADLPLIAVQQCKNVIGLRHFLLREHR